MRSRRLGLVAAVVLPARLARCECGIRARRLVAACFVALGIATSFPAAAAGGGGFAVTVNDPEQTPLQPGLTDARAHVATRPAQPGAAFVATLTDPLGRKSSQHGILDDEGKAWVVFQLTKLGGHELHVLVQSHGRRETDVVRFRANLRGPPIMVIVNGPGAGAVLRSTSRPLDPRKTIEPPPPNLYPGIADASGTVEPPARGCPDASFHGTLFGKPAPSRRCGWGKVVYWSDGTLILRLLAATITNERLTLKNLARNPRLAFRALENTVLTPVIEAVAKEERSERLPRSSARLLLEKLGKAKQAVDRVFVVLRNLAFGRGGPAQTERVARALEGTLPELELVMERLDAHKLLLKSDAPEFDAFVLARFEFAPGQSLALTIGTSPTQGAEPYRLEVTRPDGRKVSKSGKLAGGRAILTFPAPKLNDYEVALVVVGAEPVSETLRTNYYCPGGFQGDVFRLSPPIGSTGPSVVEVTRSAELFAPCDGPDGRPGKPPVFGLFDAFGAELPLRDGTVGEPRKNFRGNWVYSFEGTVTISSEIGAYWTVTWR